MSPPHHADRPDDLAWLAALLRLRRAVRTLAA
jgi:hypothetical protein